MNRVWLFGDNVDTDAIIPARYLSTSESGELARHCLEDLDPVFAGNVRPGDVIVAGANFGCGSSREHAPLAIRASGVSLVVASSFARIFFRNAINIGLPLVEAPQAAGLIRAGDCLTYDPATGLLSDLTTGGVWPARPFPAFLREIVAAGGLVELARGRLRAAPAEEAAAQAVALREAERR